jgi:hypothetical protein
LGIPLFILSIGSIFMGYSLEDLFIGIGSNFWMGSILILPYNNNEFDIEFLPFLIKVIPLIFSLGGMFSSLLFYYIYYYFYMFCVFAHFTGISKLVARINFIHNDILFTLAKPILKGAYNFFFKELDNINH